MGEQVPIQWLSLWPDPAPGCGRCGEEKERVGLAFGRDDDGDIHMVSLCADCLVVVDAVITSANAKAAGEVPS